MNPPTEQLIRDYLNQVSVAALGRLSSDERREFLSRTREELEREARDPGAADPATVEQLLSGLGQPEALVELERARLALVQDEPDRGARRLARLLTRLAAWLTGRSARRDAAARRPPSPDADLVSQPPLTGEIKISTRPVTARRRPGERRQPRRPSGRTGPSRPPRRSPGAAAAGRRSAAAASRPVAGGGQDSGPTETVQDTRSASGNWERFLAMLAGKPGPAQADGPAGFRPDRGPGQAVRSPGSAGPANGYGTGQAGGPAGPRHLAAAASRLAGSAVGVARRQPAEVAAVLLLGLGGLSYPPVWFLGAVVAIFSRRWDFRDKWAGLAGPPLLVIAGITVAIVIGGRHKSIGAYGHEVWVVADYLSRIAALAGAAFLTWRIGHVRRQPATPPWNRQHRG